MFWKKYWKGDNQKLNLHRTTSEIKIENDKKVKKKLTKGSELLLPLAYSYCFLTLEILDSWCPSPKSTFALYNFLSSLYPMNIYLSEKLI